MTLAVNTGTGKTTLLSLLSGLTDPEKGEIFYEDKNISSIDKYVYRSRYIGVVFQSYNLLTKYMALENVVLSMDIAGYKTENKTKRDMTDQGKCVIPVSHSPDVAEKCDERYELIRISGKSKKKKDRS